MSRASRARGDDGQVALLILICTVIAGALIMTAGAITEVHLGRQQLRSLADAAALSAADALDENAYYTSGLTPVVSGIATPTVQGLPLSDLSVQAAAADDLAQVTSAVTRVEGVTLATPTGSPDGRTAEVTLHASVRPWLLPAALASVPPTVDLEVTSRARAGLLLP